MLHTLRLFLAVFAFCLALYFNMTFMEFLLVYTVQMSFVYLADLLMGRYFLGKVKGTVM
ncbi:hypothetical protein D3C84_624820 [compost metagenome]